MGSQISVELHDPVGRDEDWWEDFLRLALLGTDTEVVAIEGQEV